LSVVFACRTMGATVKGRTAIGLLHPTCNESCILGRSWQGDAGPIQEGILAGERWGSMPCCISEPEAIASRDRFFPKIHPAAQVNATRSELELELARHTRAHRIDLACHREIVPESFGKSLTDPSITELTRNRVWMTREQHLCVVDATPSARGCPNSGDRWVGSTSYQKLSGTISLVQGQIYPVRSSMSCELPTRVGAGRVDLEQRGEFWGRSDPAWQMVRARLCRHGIDPSACGGRIPS